MTAYWQGLTMGLAYVAPIGLQNLFAINAAMTLSGKRVFIVAAIIVFFDVSLAFACFYGTGILMNHFPVLRTVILGVGSVIVLYIGFQLLHAKVTLTRTNAALPLWRISAMACAVTWLNPQALIDGTMMLGAFKASLPAESGQFFIYGVASSSFLWFFGISAIVSLMSAHINDRILTRVNKICGIVILLYGLKLGLECTDKVLFK